MRSEPSASGRAALPAIVGGREALVRAEDLRRLGHDEADLQALAVAGLAERWEAPDGVYWTLTPLGAERMGLTLGERFKFRKAPKGHGDDALDRPGELIEEEPYWTRAPVNRDDGRLDPLAEEVRLPNRHRTCRLGEPEWLAEPDAPDPEADALVRECADLIRRFEADPGAPGAMGLIRRAESIVEGVMAEMKVRYLWDDARALPVLIRGRLVPRDGRMGPGKTG